MGEIDVFKLADELFDSRKSELEIDKGVVGRYQDLARGLLARYQDLKIDTCYKTMWGQRERAGRVTFKGLYFSIGIGCFTGKQDISVPVLCLVYINHLRLPLAQEKRASLEVAVPVDGETPLLFCCSRGDAQLKAFMVTPNGKIQKPRGNFMERFTEISCGGTPIDHAIFNGITPLSIIQALVGDIEKAKPVE